MKFLKLFFRYNKRKKELVDYYQESVNRLGREQFVKLTQRGLTIPIAVF